MKKSLIIFTLIAFFAVGATAQDCPKAQKECPKTETKADCPEAKKANCPEGKQAECCDKTENKDQACKEKQQANCPNKEAKPCCSQNK